MSTPNWEDTFQDGQTFAPKVVDRLKQLASGATGVASVSAGDSTITVGGTAADPTVAVNAIPESKVTGLVADLAAKVTGTGTSSGTNTGDQTTVSGNAGTATALATGRAIDGVTFDGTAAIAVIAPGTHAATGKTNPVDADELPLVDSAASNVLKKLTWANLKATLKTYFDTLYRPLLGITDRATALGWKAMSIDISNLNTGANALTSQRLMFLAQYLPAGLVITNLSVYLNNTPSSLTLAKLGLYQQVGQTADAPTLVAATASQHASWTGAGLKTAAVAATVGGGAYTVPTSGLYYFAVLVVCTGSLPQIAGFNGIALTELLVPSGGFRFNCNQAGQSDLPSTAAFGTGNGFIQIWVGAT